jgi:DNA-binding MarR family transcriptional regulator
MKKDNLLHLVMLFHKFIKVSLFDSLSSDGEEITSSQLVCLRYLYLNPHSTAGDLARGLSVSCGACTRTMDRLEQKGLAVRMTNPKDRRVQQMSLTPKGKQHVEDASKQLCTRFQKMMKKLTPQERTDFESILCLFLNKGIDNEEIAEEVCLRCGILHMVDCPANSSSQQRMGMEG